MFCLSKQNTKKLTIMSQPIKYQIWVKVPQNIVRNKFVPPYVVWGYVASGYVDIYDDSDFQD